MFTDLLDEYLDAKAEVDRLREGFDGYGFSDAHWREVDRLDKARDALNAAVARATAQKD